VSWELRVVSVKALELETDENLAAALLDGWQPFAVTPDQRPLGMVFVYHMRRESEDPEAEQGDLNPGLGLSQMCWHEHPNGALYCLRSKGHAGEHRYDDRETSGGPAI
jgi:hypothetical protein